MPLFRTLTPRHRRLLAGLSVLSVAAAVWAVEFNQQQLRVNSLYAAITNAGGAVFLEAPLWRKYVASWRGQVALYQETWVVLKGESFDDEWLQDHNDLAALEIDVLAVDHCSMTVEGLRRLIAQHPIGHFSAAGVTHCDAIAATLAGEPSLWCASFNDTDLSDAGLRELPLEQLAVVCVQGTRVTPDGLLELKRCRQLGQVWLDGRQFDVRVADLLRGKGTISMLFLNGEDVTDEHLARIKGMKVQYVGLTDTSSTPEAIAALQLSLPGCRVRVDSSPGKRNRSGQGAGASHAGDR